MESSTEDIERRLLCFLDTDCSERRLSSVCASSSGLASGTMLLYSQKLGTKPHT